MITYFWSRTRHLFSSCFNCRLSRLKPNSFSITSIFPSAARKLATPYVTPPLHEPGSSRRCRRNTKVVTLWNDFMLKPLFFMPRPTQCPVLGLSTVLSKVLFCLWPSRKKMDSSLKSSWPRLPRWVAAAQAINLSPCMLAYGTRAKLKN